MVVLLDPEKRPLTPMDVEITPTGKHGLEHGGQRRRSFSHCWVFRCATFCIVVLFYRIWGFFHENRGKDIDSSMLWNTEGYAREHEHYIGHPEEDRFERLFLTVPDVDVALATSRKYATISHLAGSPEGYDSAKTILGLFQTEFNIDIPSELPVFPAGTPESRNATLGITSSTAPSAWIDVYYPVLNTPLEFSLQILDDDGKAVWSADLLEQGDERDPEAAKYADAVPTFHGFSKGGDIKGQLIYANYGSKEDFDKLAAAGVNFTGKIVLARYGANVRGLKIKAAEELGAAGLIMYSDPRDDGVVTVSNGYAPYPAGPARNPTAVQRGSVQYISVYPSDPGTPSTPAYENATRIEGWNTPNIPSLPLSWANAARLLEEIGGTQEGRLLSGRVSERTIKLVNHLDTKVTKIYNTMAAIPGHIADEVVMIGNHRDAWVMGAADPTSGTVSMHEVIRGFAYLLNNGWKPLRTIVFASWDAEEYGVIGSTEYGEDFGDWITNNVVSYLNLGEQGKAFVLGFSDQLWQFLDSSVAGSRWMASASPSLAHLIRQTAQDVPHPTQPGKTLWDARDDEGPFEGIGDEEFMASYAASELKRHTLDIGIEPLGSGSDFTVFLQHLGVASMDQSFAPTPSDAVFHYHSIYDSQHWQEQYADPGFHRHVAVARHLGLLILRLTDAIILPLNTTQYVLELHQYLDHAEMIASTASIEHDFSAVRKAINHLQSASADLDDEKKEAEMCFRDLLGKLHRRGSCRRRKFRRVVDWIKWLFGVRPHHRHQHHRFGPNYWTDVAFGTAKIVVPDVHERHHRSPEFLVHNLIEAAKRVRRANQKLIAFERGFISKEGIRNREWYKHLGVAPGLWLGYGATTLPGLVEALTVDKNAALVEHEANRLRDIFEKMSVELRR
ncbi:hypothetical protein PILCRDRAFT_1366 [Piloderma croceum F 1598]|uniref:Zn-dependent exopeptidase n=1 Tax=Piloderma croceum (strain F 1598) TaxID=765440 RepID=A0A0C3CNA8_PILCF|nr:hypothetical protein PILCRDRAFT_1366 [Piloderma croceum F 1598]